MDAPILRAEHEEFCKRMEDEHKQMAKSQSRQEGRLEELESRDGNTWRKVKWYVLTLAIGAVFGLVVAQIGL